MRDLLSSETAPGCAASSMPYDVPHHLHAALPFEAPPHVPYVPYVPHVPHVPHGTHAAAPPDAEPAAPRDPRHDERLNASRDAPGEATCDRPGDTSRDAARRDMPPDAAHGDTSPEAAHRDAPGDASCSRPGDTTRDAALRDMPPDAADGEASPEAVNNHASPDAPHHAAPPAGSPAASAQETRAYIDALAARLAARAPAPARASAFTERLARVARLRPQATQFGYCARHGRYPQSSQDAQGTVRWHSPGCPACTRLRAAEKLLARAAISPRFAPCEFGNFLTATPAQARVLSQCRRYADDFPAMRESGACLILRGQPGTGKNHLATAIAKSVLARGMTVLNATEYEIVQRLRAGWNAPRGAETVGEMALIREFAALDLLIIDEVGRSWRRRDGGEPLELFHVIDARYRTLKPTLVISNLARDALRAAMGEAAFDRLRQGGGRLIDFDWPSYRRGAAPA